MTELSLLAVSIAVLIGAGILAYRFAAEQMRSQDRLQETYDEADARREYLTVVLRSVPHGLLVLDGDGRVIVANDRAAALWGLAGGEIAGLSLQALSRRDALRRGEEPWQPADLLEDGTGTQTVGPVQVQTVVSGQILEATGTPVYSVTDKRRIGTIVLFHDVTEARRLEQMRETLTEMMIHDLRSPLSGIYTAVGILLGEGDMEREMQREMLQVARCSAERMLRMVETLIDIARLEAGRMPLERETVRLIEVAERAIAPIAPQAEAKGVEVSLTVEPPDLAAWADPGLLERVIVNLTGNAIKFTPRGGDVVIRGYKENNGDVLLSVQDTGPGIPLEDHARIFDRFTQAGQRRQWGSGLGLTFCKMAVDAHGGRIWVESASGKNSTFYVRLPLSHTHASETVRMKGTKTRGDQL